MKKIVEILLAKLSYFLNSEHLSFMDGIVALCKKFDPKKQKIEKEYLALLASCEKEIAIYDQVRSSDFTELIRISDETRTSTLKGLAALVKANLRHPNKEIANAANRLKKLLDSHEDLHNRSYDSKTAIIIDILADVAENYTAEIELLGASVWITMLNDENKNFLSLMDKRYEEENARPSTKMLEARAETDDAYLTLTTRLTALMIIEEPEKFYPLVGELNLHVKRYNERVKMRASRNRNKQKDITNAQLSTIEEQKYTGAQVIPAVTVVYVDPKTDESITLEEKKDYTVECTNNIKPGTAILTVRAKGKYSGKLDTRFNIVMVNEK